MKITSLPGLFHEYIKSVDARGVSKVEELTLEQKQHVFLMALRDFYDSKLSLDGVSHIGNALWFSLEDKTTELADAMYAVGELNYYIRHTDRKKNDVLLRFLNEAKDFYLENKHLLKDSE